MIFLVMLGSSVFSQTAMLPTTTASPGETISLPLDVTGFTDIGAITLHIQIDPTILTFAGITGAPAGTLAGVSGTTLGISWSDVTPITIGAAGTGTLLNLLFDYTGPGTSTLNFLGTCEIIQMPGYVPLAVTYTNGLVTPNLTNPTKATLFAACAVNGAAVTVPIKYEGFGSNVGSITQKVQYDPAKLTFVGVDMVGNLAGALASASGGVVTIAWENLFGAAINYPNNQFIINFTYAGTTSTDLIFYPGCLITTNLAVNIPVSYFNTTLDPVPPFAVGTVAASQTVCSGVAPATLTSTGPTGGSGTYAYQWQSSPLGGPWSDITLATSPTYSPGVLATTTMFRLTQMDVTCGYSGNTNDVTITVYDPLAAGTIAADQTICNGATPAMLTTTVAPSGGSGTYSYQWQMSADGVIWIDISGATGTTYSPGALTSTTYYRNQVTDVTCGDIEYTNELTITVYPAFAVGTIAASQTICNGATPAALTTTVPPTGSGSYTYQWQSSADGVIWSDITGATGTTYAPGALTTTMNYRKMVTDAICLNTGYTNELTVMVYPAFTSGTIDASQTICNGATPASLTTTVSPTGSGSYTYQWQSSVDAVTWSDIAGATGTTYAPGALTATMYYRKMVTDAICLNTGYTNELTVMVYPAFAVGTIAASQTICNGATPTVLTTTVAPTGSGSFTYQWQSSADGVTWSDITGATGITYAPGALTVTMYYRKMVTDAICLNTGYTNELTIMVYPAFAVGTIAASQTICNGATPAPLTTTVPPTGSGSFTYQWQSSTDAVTWSDITGATGTSYAPGAFTGTMYFRKMVTDAICLNTGYTNELTITVYPAFAVGTIAASQTICNGVTPAPLTTTVPPTGSGSFTYQWQTSLPNGIWSDITGATTDTYAPGALTTTTLYRKQVTDVICGDMDYTNELTIMVYPAFAVGTIAASQTICNGATPAPLTTTVPPTGSGSYSYQWQMMLPAGFWTDITGATTDTYAPGPLTITTMYRKMVTDLVCDNVGYTNELTIMVYDAFDVGAIAASQTICYGATPAPLTTTLPPAGSGSYTYQWQSSADAVTWTDITGATTDTYAPGALTATTYYRKMVTDVICDNTGYTNELTIMVYPAFDEGTIAASQTICNGATPDPITTTLAPTGSGSFSYQWQSSPDGVTWTDITGATGTTYAPGPLTATTYYRKMVTDVICDNTGYTNEVIITVYSVLGAGTIEASQTICSGTAPDMLTTTIAPSGGSGSYSLQWQSSPDGITWTDITGETGSTYAPGVLTATMYYRITVTDDICLNSEYTNVLEILVNATPPPPEVSVVDDCGFSTLTAVGIPGATFLWSTGETTASITVTVAGLYTVTQTSPEGCISAAGSGTAAPFVIPAAPVVTVVDDCGFSTLTATGVTGATFMWSTGETTASITVTVAGPYTVTQTSPEGCISPAGTGTANPLIIPPAPTVTVVDACGFSTLTATGETGATFMWTTGETTAMITVTAAGTYSVTQTVGGCTSLPGAGTAAPFVIPAAPVVTVVNSCGFSTLTASGVSGATFMWSTGETTAMITVTVAGTYTVTQTSTQGCTSPEGSGVADPMLIPAAPVVIVVDGCGFSTLTATGETGATFLWSTGETTASIIVTVAGPYTVTQTVGGCTSLPGTGTAAPIPIPAAPVVNVVNNCGFSTLTAIGGTGATFLWSTGETTASITVSVAGPYTVTQTVAGCTSLPGTGTATPLIIPPAPTVTVVNNCGNSVLTATGETGATFLWSTGETTAVITVTVAGPYTVTQTTPNLCTSLPGSGTAAPMPIPVPTLTGNTPVCSGAAGNVYTTEAGMTDYVWTVSAGGTIESGGTSTDNTVTVTWTTAGPQTVSVSYTNTFGCTALAPTVLTVTVNALPLPTISGPTTPCQSATGNVYTTQAGMTNYLWLISPGGTVTAGGTPTSNSVTVTWNTAGPQLVSVNYTDANGCTATVPGSLNVNVNPTPVPSIIIYNNDPCVGATMNQFHTEGGMSNYVWTVTSGGTITAGQGTSAITVTWTAVGLQTITVSYTSTVGCPTITPSSHTMLISPPPSPAGPITGSTTVCAGAMGVAYSTSPVAGALTYAWTVPAGASIASGAGTIAITVNFSTSAVSGNVTVAGVNDCGEGVASTLAVTVNQLPGAAGVITGDDQVCAPSTGHVYTVPAIANATSYSWTVPAGATIVSGGTTNSITVNYSAAAVSGAITVYGVNSCGDGTVSPNFNVTVTPVPPAPVITLDPDGITLTSSAPTGNQWYFSVTPGGPGAIIPGATAQVYEATQSGYYWSVVTINGCISEESNHIQVVMVGQEELNGSTFSIYPVPSDGHFNFSIEIRGMDIFTIQVYNQVGEKLVELRDIEVSGKLVKEIDLRPVPKGVYSVVFRTKEYSIVRKVIVY